MEKLKDDQINALLEATDKLDKLLEIPDDASDDFWFVDDGSSSEVPKPPAISSFEDLLSLINQAPEEKPEFYEVTTQDDEVQISSSDERLLLDYLPAYVGTLDDPLQHSDSGLRSFRFLGAEMLYNSRQIKELIDQLKDIDLLHAGQLVSVEKGLVSAPYGSLQAVTETYNTGIQLNPLILSVICDAYRDQTVFSRSDICQVVKRNMIQHFMPSGEGADWSADSKSHAIIFSYDDSLLKCMPKSKSPEYDNILRDARECHGVLHRLFFHTVLPIVFLDDRFKAYIGCSLLIDEELDKNSCRKLYLAFLYFLCSCGQISRVANSKFKDIASLDAKALFAHKKPFVPRSMPLAPRSKNAVVKVTLAVNAEKKEEIELTGLVVTSKALQAFADLCGKHPHFHPVFDYLLPFVEASFTNSTPLVFPPILIAGPPGIGKTKFISELFAVFDYPVHHCHSSQFTCGSGLVGLQSTWGTAQPGYVSDAIRRSKHYNPLIAFDELERVRMATSGGNGISVEAAFMRLLEPLEASRFVDACGNIPVDVSKVNWIFTCNDPSMIPSALLTRLNKVCVYPPIDEVVIDMIHRDIWTDLVNQYAAHSRVNPWISEDAIDYLRELYYKNLNFRAGIKVFKLAINKLLAGAMGASYLTLDVIESKVKSPASYN